MEEEKNIVISTLDREKALFVIARNAVDFDRIEIDYHEKYSPTINYLLPILRKGFGWLEYSRGETEVDNKKCKFCVNGICDHKELKERKIICVEKIRSICANYERKYSSKIHVNFVKIKKVGQIRGL